MGKRNESSGKAGSNARGEAGERRLMQSGAGDERAAMTALWLKSEGRRSAASMWMKNGASAV